MSDNWIEITHWFPLALAILTPCLIVAIYIRRKREKRLYYAQSDDHAPIEGTIDELNAVDPNASPWVGDQRKKLNDTKELVGRYNTLDGYSERYVEDLMTRIRLAGIACDYVFQETLPMGVAAAIVTRVGTFELFADRARVDEALKIIEDFKALT